MYYRSSNVVPYLNQYFLTNPFMYPQAITINLKGRSLVVLNF